MSLECLLLPCVLSSVTFVKFSFLFLFLDVLYHSQKIELRVPQEKLKILDGLQLGKQYSTLLVTLPRSGHKSDFSVDMPRFQKY